MEFFLFNSKRLASGSKKKKNRRVAATVLGEVSKQNQLAGPSNQNLLRQSLRGHLLEPALTWSCTNWTIWLIWFKLNARKCKCSRKKWNICIGRTWPSLGHSLKNPIGKPFNLTSFYNSFYFKFNVFLIDREAVGELKTTTGILVNSIKGNLKNSINEEIRKATPLLVQAAHQSIQEALAKEVHGKVLKSDLHLKDAIAKLASNRAVSEGIGNVGFTFWKRKFYY